jgi:N utilization substance protein A
MDKEIEAIIAEEAGLRSHNRTSREEDIEVVEEDQGSDAYTDADRREEQLELMNDTIDTLVDESQDVSTEGIDNGGWDHN